MHLSAFTRKFRRPISWALPFFGAALLASLPAAAGSSTTKLFGSASTSVYGQQVTFGASVRGALPSGKVTLKDGSKKIGVRPLSPAIRIGSTVATGGDFTCAVTSTGGVKCWGENEYGQLGNGDSGYGADIHTPVQVFGLTSGFAAVAAGYEHACALTKTGAVKCWGRNDDGQLGNGTWTISTVPVQVTGLTSGVTAIAARGDHTCALTKTGAVKCWGYNYYGQLGNGDSGSYADSPIPVQVRNLTSGVAAIDVGSNHTCALTEAGAAKCWGENYDGQLGNNNPYYNSSTPVQVLGLTSGVASIAAGYDHTCAVTDNGAAKCWGDNYYGALGNGTTTDSYLPVQVVGFTSGAAAIDAGTHHTCALTRAGGAKCWGYNDEGQLGDGNIGYSTSSKIPVQVVGLTSGAASIATGYYHTCALTRAGGVTCWGQEYGNGTTTDSGTPVSVFGLTASVPSTARSTAVISTSTMSVGSHRMKAFYSGDSNNAASASAVRIHRVSKGKTRIAMIKVKPSRPRVRKVARIKVNVMSIAPARGNPEGKVLVKDGRKRLGKFKVKNGKASFKARFRKSGNHKLKVIYKGDKNWTPSALAKRVTVRR